MSIWALADLHLAFGAPSKSMEVFGPSWADYANRIETHWRKLVQKEDLVLLPGDLSWAQKLEDALIDLRWIDALPGTKLILKGNHDYWWPSASKLSKNLPSSIHFIQNNAFLWNDVAVGGSRLWDSSEYDFSACIDFQENPRANVQNGSEKGDPEPIFQRELERLRLSLQQLDPKARRRIAITHYPPIGANLAPSRASAILEEFHIEACLFGHLHNVKQELPLFGTARGVTYSLVSADYLNFSPLRVDL